MDNKLVIIDSERLQGLIDSINSLREAVLNAQQTNAPAVKQLPVANPSPLNWMPLEEFLVAMGFNKRHFERHYKKRMKYKVFAHRIFIHKPSLDEWFIRTAIN